eukprot:CCRYP_010501-RA/>CCRYP_010501-RA protein AED:0.04 eAED:0.04 QI:149/1/1/1/1/1/4/351/772
MHAFIAIASCWRITSMTASFVPISSNHIISSRRPRSLPQQQQTSSCAQRTTLLNSDMGRIILDDLSRMTIAELKAQLRRVDLPVGGRKQELCDRLSEYYSSKGQLHTHVDEDCDESAIQELENLTVPVLRERLKMIGLPVSGRKQELIHRLREYHQNTNKFSDNSTSTINQSIESSNWNAQSTTIDNPALPFGSGEDVFRGSIQEDLIATIDKFQSNENSISRKARRKKYFKTQEVRELIRASDPRAPAKAEEMIATLEQMAKEENNDEYLPGPRQYTVLIDAYAKSQTSGAEEVIERIMKSNIELTTTMMNAIMGAYASMGTVEGAKQATTILERMEYIRDLGGGAVKPTVYSYSLAISAWAKCHSLDSATCAENILTRLLESYEKVLMNGNQSDYAEELKPNSVVFNSVIDAWASSGSPVAGEKAESLVNKMETYSRMDYYDVRPDTITFNTCIKAWCNSNCPDAPQKAEEILCKLETQPHYPRKKGVLIVRPNLLSYNTVINSWAKSSDPESAMHAQSLLMRMLKNYKADAFSTVKPDVVTFSSVLNALAKSKAQNKANKCLKLLETMIDLHDEDGSCDTTPNVICYNTVLNACAFSALADEDEKKRALEVAVKVFKLLNEERYVRPDAVSYGNMLKCCANLMPPGNARTSMASTIFSKCCEAGMVGGMVLDEIRRSIPSKEFLLLLAECGYEKPLKQHKNAMSIELRQLPRQWTVNVKVGDMSSRQRSISVKHEKQTRKERSHSKPIPPVIRRPGFLIEPSWASGKDV